jgi:hypothetical protein
MRVVGVEVAVHAPVGQHQQRVLLAPIQTRGDEDVGVHLEGVALVGDPVGRLALRVGDGGEEDLVEGRHVADALEPQQVVDLFHQTVEREVGLLQPVFQSGDPLVQWQRSLVGRGLVGPGPAYARDHERNRKPT